MRVVLDTNVVVSGLLPGGGPPAAILRLLPHGLFKPCFDERMLAEYHAILRRPRLRIRAELADKLFDDLARQGLFMHLVPPLPFRLPDRDDECFLETAAAVAADFLVTGNLKDFPPRLRAGVRVVSPREFFEALRRR